MNHSLYHVFKLISEWHLMNNVFHKEMLQPNLATKNNHRHISNGTDVIHNAGGRNNDRISGHHLAMVRGQYYIRFNGLFSRTTWLSQHPKGKPFWIGLYWSRRWWGGTGISWTIRKSFAPHSRQITTPVPHHSVFYRRDALPATQPTASKHWRQNKWSNK